MKYVATFKVYLDGPENYILELDETKLKVEQEKIYELTLDFLAVLSSMSNILVSEGFLPVTAKITVDGPPPEEHKEQGDGQVT